MTSAFPGAETQRPTDDRAPLPEGIRLFSAVERLVGEEYALLAIPAHQRTDAQRSRLSEITEQLDRLWEKLRERADSRGLKPDAARGDTDAAAS